MAADDPLVAFASGRRPAPLRPARPFEPQLRDLRHRERRALDSLATVHAREQLRPLGLGVGLRASLGCLPDLSPGRVAVAELVLPSGGFAGVAVHALVDALGDPHPAWVWPPPPHLLAAVLGQCVLHGSYTSGAGPRGAPSAAEAIFDL